MLRFVLLLVVFLPFAAGAQDATRQIVVSATGTADATPDMATLNIGVSREAPTAAEAMSAMAAAAHSVLEEVTAQGIEARDVQTASVNLNPVWEDGDSRPPQVRGYAASTMVNVRVRDLELLGPLLDRVVGRGANELNGLTFGVADTEALEAEARADAVRRATQKAATLAEAAGVLLGPVLTISEGGGMSGPAPMLRGAAMEAAAMPIAAGELTFRVTVTASYAISE